MRNILYKKIMLMSRYALIGLFSQFLIIGILWANRIEAQPKKLNEIYLSVDFTNQSLDQVFQSIESKTGFKFTYLDHALDNSTYDFHYRKISLEALLTRISKEARIKFKRVNNNIHISILKDPNEERIEEVNILGQTRNITGTVTSFEDNEPLPGVNVVEKGTTNGTVTNVDGEYNLTVSEGVTLVFSSVGYTTEEVPVGNQSLIDMVMTEDIQQLQELVVVGYGSQKKSDLTGSVVSVKSEDIQNQGQKVNVLETVLGLTPGLNLTLNSNTAEQESVGIQIRGRNSITASNTPLIVLDGVPYAGGLNELNQSDIESIDVLKDASSTAIYGARGANGVIIITTKQGGEGKPRISYDGSYGLKQLYNLPPLMNGQQHWDFTVERYSEDVAASYPTRLENYQAGNSTDWVDLATQTGKQMSHNLKIEGGSEQIKYFVSGTYSDIEGVAVGDKFQQYAFRTNFSFDITDWFTFGTNTQYTDQDLSGLNANFQAAFFLIPLINPYEDDGSIALYPWPEEPVFQNPLSNLNVEDEQFNRTLFSNNYLKIDFPFVPGLSYKLNTGLTFINEQIGRFWGANTVPGFENNGQAFTQNVMENDRLIENLLVYDKSWDQHNLNVTALYSTQRYKLERRTINSRDFPTGVLTWYQHDVASVIEPSSNYLEQKYVSQMGRVNYNYNSRYLLTLTLRRDGYSGFGSENKFGVFPSMAVGWNLGDEAFMATFGWLDQLKLRASFGRNGNQAINPYQTLSSLAQLNYLAGDGGTTTAPGYLPGSLASPSLGWETSNSLNLGLDFMALNGRLQGAIDYYNTNTYDLLLNRSISPVHGITNITQNIGETNNRGIELYLRSINVDNEVFSWSTNLNFAHNKNEIVDLYGDGKDDIANGWFIGKSIDANFGYVFDGVWQQNDDIDNGPQPNAAPGDVRVKDTDGDGDIDPDDRDFLGQVNPKFTAGLTNTLNYKNFTLSFIFFTQQGVTRINPLWETDMVWADVRRNSIILNNWSEDNPTNEYPANRDGTNPFEVQFFQDASFVRLRDVTLAYSFDNNLINSLGFSRLQLNFNIRNALTFTSWEGLDPELSNQRGIPIDRTFLFGLNFAF